MIAVAKILVATDFGEASETALAYGRALSGAFGATLHLLHVTHDVYALATNGSEFTSITPTVLEDIERAGREQTQALLTDEDRKSLNAVAVTVTHFKPAAAIVEYAQTNKVDLIVLGTHGRGALSRLLLGSVAERVVRTAPCPVLTVRHPEHEFVLPDALVAMPRT